MAISRPFLLAVLGAVLLGATVLAVQNARDTSTNDATPAAIQAKPAPTAPTTATASPSDELQSAFDLSKVNSGKFAGTLSFGAASIGVAGAFDRPSFQVSARIGHGKQAVKGGLVSDGGKAYFVSGDTGWRVPSVVWGPATQKLPLAVHPASWARDVKSEGTETVGGVKTEHLSGRLDPQAAFNDLAPIVGSAKAAAPKRASFDVWIAKSDHVMRRLDVVVVAPHRARFELDVRLSDLNKPQKIQAPAHVRTGVPSGSLSPFADVLVRRIDRATGTKSASLEALTSPNPGRAARAVRHHQKVVILFRNKHGLDDRAMASVMSEVDRRTKALVLVDPVDAVDRYGKLVQDLGVDQTPSVVIIGRSGKARLIEGYVDATTLTQAVTETR